MWLSGTQQSQRSAGSTPMLNPEPTAFQRKFPKVSPTGFGEPELPLVRTRAQTSSMSCSPSRGRSASVWVSRPGSSRSTIGSSAATIAARSAEVRRGLSGSSLAPTFINAWSRTTCSRRGCIVSAAVEPRRTPCAASRRATQVASASSSA